MIRYYKCKYFRIEELVDPATFQKYGERCWSFFDPRILITLDAIRVFLGKPITVNNWYWNGDREWSGLRTPNSAWYSTYSQHTFGRAIDFVVKGMDAPTVQSLLVENEELFPYLTRMEEDRPTWTHIDCANVDEEGIYVFKP